ncbi:MULTISPECIES: MFS transporter [unclassified Synechococcus]|uniref:MFS transporter n=1 Tax=unclassified Synechococcus TaxID=2626047 RepID=UPI001E63B6C7|nr:MULTISPECIES: MFS transporter [unclassified Synechococcus]MEA5421931.1 MFS transporter [Synechococcus sp. CCY9202]
MARAGSWFHQFPAPLRELVLIRLIGSLGAGGVVYLTPMVFHQADFSASSVTQGLALAALAGTGGRLLCGLLLDRGLNCTVPVLMAVLLSLAGDSLLAGAWGWSGFLQGQLLLGASMGLYWPAIELAVPLSCEPVSSARGYALARSADAAGIAAGALLGALLAWGGRLRGIYLVDIACLVVMALLLLLRPLPDPRPRSLSRTGDTWRSWLPPLLPLLALTVLATAMPALMQSALPLDLVRGGLQRPPLPDSQGALMIGLQLALLLLLQWPVGQALARRPVGTGLGLSLVCFACGSLLLAVSALHVGGAWLIMLAQLPLALGQAAFLPIASEAVVELTPLKHQGLALALFSQCFAVSALTAPLLAGQLLDRQGHGAGLWLTMTLLYLVGLRLVRLLHPRAAGPRI